MPRYDLIAGLDIGADKICLALARGQIQRRRIELLGRYAVESSGLQEGSVVDLSKAADSVGMVLEQAQDASGQKISSAFVSIMAKHITAESARGRVNILYKESEVSKKDLEAACRMAKASVVTYDREPILVAPQNYIVDGESVVQNPVGLSGTKFEADFYIITGSTPAIGNLIKAVNMGGLEVEELVLSNLANSFSAITAQEKDLGVVLVDIGSDVTEISVFSEAVIRYDKMLSCGSQQIVNVVRDALKVDTAVAEGIVKNYCRLDISGSGIANEKILIKEAEPAKIITSKQLEKLAEPAIREILSAINKALQGLEYSKMAASGIVLIGGISRMDGMAELAEQIFNMPVKVGSSSPDPVYTTAIGLINYGWDKCCRRAASRQFSENAIKRAFIAARDFVYDYF